MQEEDNKTDQQNENRKEYPNLIPYEKGKEKTGGRAKGTPNRSTIAKLVLGVKKKVLIDGVEQMITVEEIMTRAIAMKASSGDTAAYKALLDSSHGAPKQEINQTIDDKRIELED